MEIFLSKCGLKLFCRKMCFIFLFFSVYVRGQQANYRICSDFSSNPQSVRGLNNIPVVGGVNGHLPWHAGIYTKKMSPYMQICGGSLINQNVILSAAHCFWKEWDQLPATDFAVAVGKMYRAWNDPKDNAQKSDVKTIHIPPRYQGPFANFQDDLALLVVTKGFSFDDNVRPICLYFNYMFEKQQLQSGNEGKVAGWGLTEENGKVSQILQVVDLPYVDIETCIKNSPTDFRGFITCDKICAGTLDSNLALCRGDSGGGLAFPSILNGIEIYFLRGIVSTGPNNENDCNVHTYTTFTSVLKHEQFIMEFWNEK